MQRFVAEDRPWLVGARVAEWAGDTGGVGSALPDGFVAVVSSDTVARKFLLFLYDGTEHVIEVPFSTLAVEPGTVFPTGRFDPQGTPTILYHYDPGFKRGQLKIFIRAWNGGSGTAPLLRIYTWVRIQEV